MFRRVSLLTGLLMLAICGMQVGCASPDVEPVVLGSPALLFAKTPMAFEATGFGRSSWPATYGGIESVEETVFVEHYRDYTGSASQERNTPSEYLHSYRVGKRLR